jgi:hypothetical protein
MTAHIAQLISGNGWFAVVARLHAPSGSTSNGARPGGPRSGSGPAPEFVPIIAWALLRSPEGEDPPIVGVVTVEGRQVELIAADDPAFLGYAGPGDPALEPQSFAPDWRSLARAAVGAIRTSSEAMRVGQQLNG